MANGKLLGRALLDVLKGVNALIPMASPAELETLAAQREKLLDEIARLVDENLDRADQRYRAATARLEFASGVIERALRDMATVAEVIIVLGTALALAAEVAP